jgi:hypothetical protein
MRLSVRAERVETAICLFEVGILGICLEPLVDSGKANELQETT